MYIERIIELNTLLKRGSILLLGPRRTGKSAYIRNQLSPTRIYNLLEADTFQRLSARPSLMREELQGKGSFLVIDEIQKLPQLMDEVHLMIEEYGVNFLLTGSSVRKLTRNYTKLMGGRARTMRLHPLCYAELKRYDLLRTLTVGAIPSIYLHEDPWSELRSYVSDYIREEIAAEGISRKIEQFSRFLEVAALSHTEQVNFEEIGRDAQVSPRTVRDYYAILSDTLLGEVIAPYRKHPSRKAVTHGKFYFFDIAVAHGLLKIKELSSQSVEFARSFEHLVYRELKTFCDYKSRDSELTFYRDTSKKEIDFIINDEVAIEVKSTEIVHDRDLKTLIEIGKEISFKRRIIVCREKHQRKVNAVEIMPIEHFLQELWEGRIA